MRMPAEIATLRTSRPEVRVVHLGLGAFHRAHQAWYTERANAGGEDWGIAAFTGRSPDAALALSRQDGVYTLIERGPEEDRAVVISSIVEAHDGADAEAWRSALASPRVAVLTLTVTEAGYHADADGGLDGSDPSIRADIAALLAGGPAATAPGRIVDGLRARRAAGAGGIAVVSCDNLPDNGQVTQSVVMGVARAVDAELADWIAANASFVSTMVDRITPETTAEDRVIAGRLVGVDDDVPVVAEPFSEWVLSGAFPGGRPAWEAAGARFVDDIVPYEQRKLWLLNAGHSLLAYRGLLAGLDTIDEAMTDAGIVAELEELWREAREVLPLGESELDAAVSALHERFTNGRIRHTLRQIARDGSHKLPVRIVAPLRRRLANGLDVGRAQAGTLAAWGACLVRFGPTDDSSSSLAAALGAGPDAGPDTGDHAGVSILEAIASELAGDAAVRRAVAERFSTLLTESVPGKA
ncbi:mannitol dehydrogenase family protein [Rathayibacter sp. YIM 133350]|uniref:mannitol dehydrogenase family protein n=1 Tax=Rathayibacter sp. YIM 133350 TaxID=3131992 RepID=UPI00307E8050